MRYGVSAILVAEPGASTGRGPAGSITVTCFGFSEFGEQGRIFIQTLTCLAARSFDFWQIGLCMQFLGRLANALQFSSYMLLQRDASL